jgi:hypothetical protein
MKILKILSKEISLNISLEHKLKNEYIRADWPCKIMSGTIPKTVCHTHRRLAKEDA